VKIRDEDEIGQNETTSGRAQNEKGQGKYPLMLIGFAIWTLVASLITAILYAWDKRAAQTDRRRIPERTLLGWSLVGGWPGGWIAGRWLRHKTYKRSYRIQFALAATLNLLGIAAVVYASFN
tara:strand:- start:949 stop:1314 length:366 start_codon:yes stop_codon:yes gene_type:complete